MFRHPLGKIASHIEATGEVNICTSLIVVAELRCGAAKSGSGRIRTRLDNIFARIEVAPFDKPAESFYGELRYRLEKAGTPMGSNDMLIAAHALALGCTIVTNNEREFSKVEGLRAENWLKDD